MGSKCAGGNMPIITASEESYACIKEFEGLRLRSYRCPAGMWTIGWGHTKGTKQGQSITKEQAETFLRRDILQCEKAISRLVHVPLTQGQFDALTSWIFNLGESAVQSSTLIRLLNQGEMESAALEFSKWVFSSGVVLPGLVARRSAEQTMFSS
jgi:lysozyme